MRSQLVLFFLERWLAELRDPDPEQRAWKRAHAETGVIAYERLGVLSREEAARWRQRLDDPLDEAIDPGSELGPEAIAAAEGYLRDLVDRLDPLRREPDPSTRRAHAEFDAALRALREVGAVDDEGWTRWQAAAWRRKAPWAEGPIVPPDHSTFFTVMVPPANEREAAEDAARAAEWESLPRAIRIQRVITGSTQRQDDLAMVALIVHEDAVSLHFHHLGEPLGAFEPEGEPNSLEAFEQAFGQLAPPVLCDQTGQPYNPVGQRPVSATGAGGLPDPKRREAITGHWLYTPAAPPDANEFTVKRDGHTWTIRESA